MWTQTQGTRGTMDQYSDNLDSELNTDKIAKEMDASHPIEKIDDSNPIAFNALDEMESAEKQKKCVTHLMSKFTQWETARQSREQMWEQLYRLYFTIPDKFKTPTRSSITLPIVFQVVESAVPKIMNTLFASGESFFDVTPRNPERSDLEIPSENIKRLLDTQLEKAEFFSKFLDFTKQLMLYGTSYFKVYWKVKRDWVWERIPNRVRNTVMGIDLGDDIQWEETKSYKVLERRPECEVLDILDVFPDPDAAAVQEGLGVFIRSWIDKDDLVEMGQGKYPVYANTADTALTATAETKDSAKGYSQRFAARGLNSQNTDRKNQVEILEFWGKYDIDGDGIKEECQIVIGNRQVMLKGKGNPFHHQKRPIVKTSLFPVPKEWYGVGLIEPVIGQVYELNTLRRQRLDNINLVINRMWKVNTFADVDLDTLISAPNNIVLTDTMDAVEPLDTKDVTGNAYNEASIIQNDIERATVPPSAQGQPTGGQLGRTARGAQLIIGQALEKFGTATKLIEETALKPILEFFHQLNLQFIDDDQTLRDPLLYKAIAELQMTPEQLREDVTFKLLAISEMVGSEAKINQLASTLGIGGTILDLPSLEKILKRIYKLQGFPESEIMVRGLQQGVAGSIVDPNVQQAITGQAKNQGLQAAPPTIPGVSPS